MEINLSKFAAGATIFFSILLIAGFGYFMYTILIEGNDTQIATSIESVNGGSFGPKMQKAVAYLSGSANKISLKKKDLAFTETTLFKSFVDIPEDIPLSDSRGRPNPFVPYVAP